MAFFFYLVFNSLTDIIVVKKKVKRQPRGSLYIPIGFLTQVTASKPVKTVLLLLLDHNYVCKSVENEIKEENHFSLLEFGKKVKQDIFRHKGVIFRGVSTSYHLKIKLLRHYIQKISNFQLNS